MKKFVTCSEAFDGYLKELALDNFPTGNGQWRNNLRYRSDLLQSSKTKEPSLITTESLHELNQKGPFKKDVKWSRDVKKLQSDSVEDPALIDKKNLHLYIKHLRLVDKNISTLDYDFHKFSNLSELILSANYIEEVNAAALPSKLKVLELCGNRLTSVESLSLHGPPLQHLGLGYNLIKSVSDFVEPMSWECLLSLDLSFNRVDNLKETSAILSFLPKLRNLLLQGNPVFLFAGYRGYVIDTIKTLSILDDVKITADERHVFKGISTLKDLPLEEFQFNVNIDHLKGFEKQDDCGNIEEFPRTIIKYHVEIDFISSYEVKDQEHSETTTVVSHVASHGTDGEHRDSTSSRQKQPPQVITSKLIQTNELPIPTPLVENETDVEISFQFAKAISSNNLSETHELLSKKIAIRVVENRILVKNEPKPNASPPVVEKIDATLKEPMPKKDGKSKSKISLAKQQKDEKDKAATKGGGGGGGGGKAPKKLTDNEAHEWSRTQYTIACSNIELDQLLTEDCSRHEQVIKFERLPVPAAEPRVESAAKNNTLNNSHNKKSDSTKKLKNKDKDLSGRSPSRTTSVRNSSRSKMKCDTPSTTATTISETIPPKDITLSVAVELVRWKSVKDGALHTKDVSRSVSFC